MLLFHVDNLVYKNNVLDIYSVLVYSSVKAQAFRTLAVH